MKILHVVPSFGLGGMEKIICALIANTSHLHRHEILSLDGNTSAKQWIKDAGVRFIDFDKPGERGSYFRALYSALRETRPELLMTYNWGATDTIWLGRLAGIRNVLHSEHGFNADESITTLWKRDWIRFLVYRLASAVIVVSHDLQQMLQGRLWLDARRVKRIPNGINASHYCPDRSERRRVRTALGFPESALVIGFSGRLDPVKNLDFLVEVFCQCVPQVNPFRLLIVGDGPERQRLEERCRDKQIREYVVFAGEQDQVLPYLRAMDVFLLTSLSEQMPLTVLEAMAVGIPVVATRVGEIPYIIGDGTDGFVRDLRAPVEEFVEPLRLLLSSTRQKAMGEAARKKIIAGFRCELMVQRYSDIIQGFAG